MSELPPLAQSCGEHPTITPLTWSRAKDVMPHKAQDFTPWLADNLELLAEKLGLDQLVLPSTEWKLDALALDILALGSDADGDDTVVIENQWSHGSQAPPPNILTYAARAAARGHRVLAVWITEEVRPAHLAAVEFINRMAATDASTFGMVLLRVRFAPAPARWHVNFEVKSEPNPFLADPGPGGGGAGTPETMATHAAFIEALVPLLDHGGARSSRDDALQPPLPPMPKDTHPRTRRTDRFRSGQPHKAARQRCHENLWAAASRYGPWPHG